MDRERHADMSNAVREIARHRDDPSAKHYRAALKNVHSLEETLGKGIIYSKSPLTPLVALADSRFAEVRRQ